MAPETARVLAGRACAALGLVACLAAPAHALRVVDYNILNYPGTTSGTRNPLFRTILSPLGADVLVVEEMKDQAGVDQFLANILDVMEPSQWQKAPFTLGNDTNSALFYKPSQMELLGHWAFYPNPANHLRLVHVWRMRPVGYASGATEIRFYSVHLKASNGTTEANQRLAEATGMRDSMNAAPPGTHCVALGDFNFYRGTELAMSKLLENQADNDGRLYDPLGLQDAAWQDNASMAVYHTQSPCKAINSGCASGASTGGMDDRFDLFLPTENFRDATGIELIPSSYATVGNDGQHLNKSIMDAPTLPEGAPYADALYRSSDHLPLRVDLSLPAIFAGAPALDFGTVIAGGSADYTVTNAATVPADGLSYSLDATTGFAATAGSFEVAPTANAAQTIATTSGAPFGARIGTLMLTTDAPDAPAVNVSLTANVLDHAAASLDSESIVIADSIVFDHAGGEFHDLDVRVHNQDYDPLQARLAVATPSLSGADAARFAMAPFAGELLSGTGTTLTIHFDESGATTDQVYTAVLTIPSADEDLPGAAAQPDLTVQLRGIVRGGGITAVGDALPRFTRMLAPFPNPLVGSATVRFDLAERGRTRVGVFDLAGRRVVELTDGEFAPGHHSVRWNGRDEAGAAVGPGVYFIRMNGPQGERGTARIAVVR